MEERQGAWENKQVLFKVSTNCKSLSRLWLFRTLVRNCTYDNGVEMSDKKVKPDDAFFKDGKPHKAISFNWKEFKGYN